jgi:hypothetical protein
MFSEKSNRLALLAESVGTIPVREPMFPLRDGIFPVREEMFPLREGIFPVREAMFPLREEMFPARTVEAIVIMSNTTQSMDLI